MASRVILMTPLVYRVVRLAVRRRLLVAIFVWWPLVQILAALFVSPPPFVARSDLNQLMAQSRVMA